MATPPASPLFDENAEAAVLGAVLLDNQRLEEVRSQLAATHFYQRPHQILWRVFIGLADELKPIDTVTVTDRLTKADLLKPAGGGAYLVDLINRVPASTNIRHYAEIVRELALRRTAQDRLREALAHVSDPTKPDWHLTAASAAQTVDHLHTGQDAPQLADCLDQSLDTLDERARGEQQPLPVPWVGLKSIRFWPGLYVLAGGTGSGKTQFALQWGLEVARQRIPVLYIGLELDQLQLTCRLLGLQTGVQWSQLYNGDPDTLRTVRDREGHNSLRALPLHIQEVAPYGWSYDELRTNVRSQLQLYDRPPFVILDYLQLVQSPPDNRREDLRERIGKAAYFGRAVAREFSSTVLMISSTAREKYSLLQAHAQKAEARALEHADLGLPSHELVGVGKESGEIEFAADGQLVITRTDDGTYWLAVPKVRAGVGCWAPLVFDGGRFKDRAIEQETAGDIPL